MKLLAISGSARRLSTNTAMLRAVSELSPAGLDIEVYDGIGALPVFSPDLEGEALPDAVRAFIGAIDSSDGLIIACPEYVRTLPGGLKNAIDWLVSGEEVVTKPVAVMHASYRGDDMLATLRLVLSTVSVNFSEEIFLRLALNALSPEEIGKTVNEPEIRTQVIAYLDEFARFCRGCRTT